MTTPRETTVQVGEDVLSLLAGISGESAVGHLHAQRPEIVRYAEGSYRALVEPEEVAGLSRFERDLVGLRVATLTGSTPLAAWHRRRLRAIDVAASTIAAIESAPTSPPLSAREQAIIRHVDRVTQQPASATAADLAELSAVGLSAHDIVVLGQLTAFFSFQLRALVGLRLLVEA
jgi:uncharacterized peroxidase-related enzyme